MAEFVHRNTEEMINELEQLQRTKLFSSLEVKAIIKKRLRHEYKLVRIQRQKQDFLAYIQYEINLLGLIHQRRKAIQYYFKKDEIEFAIIARIHRIFKRATFLWASDIKMWLSHARFCKKWNKVTQLSKICTHMLQIHGSKPHLWILAAKWEIEVCKSMDNGRSIFMKALKRHPDHKKLWVEFFRAELMFAQKLRGRMKVLASADMDIDDVSHKEAKLMQGGAALIVYRNACVAIPNDPEFYIDFLHVISCFLPCSPFAMSIIRDMEYYLNSAFSTVPVVRSELAKLRLNLFYGEFRDKGFANKKTLQRNCDKQCFEAYEESVKKIDSNEMWGRYVDCLLELCQDLDPSSASVLGESTDSVSFQRVTQTIDVVFRAHNRRKLPARLYAPVSDFLVNGGRTMDANRIINEICEETSDPSLWLKKIELFSLSSGTDSCKPNKIAGRDLFLTVLNTVPSMKKEEEAKFWRLWMEYAILHNKKVMAKKIVTSHSVKSGLKTTSHVLGVYLKWIAASDGVKATYKVFVDDVCSIRTPALEHFLYVIDLCRSFSFDDLTKEGFELALRKHGKYSVDLWLKYIEHSRRSGKASDVGAAFWRAKNSLEPSLVQRFFTQFSLLDASLSEKPER